MELDAGSLPVDVAERAGHVEVRGVSRQDVSEAIDLLVRVRRLQADQMSASRDSLVRALMTSHVSLTPPATLAQARRLAAHRDALLATPVLTYATLCELRGDRKESSTRTWVARKRAVGALFTVAHNGRTLIPAFQLDEHGDARPELRAVLTTLLGAVIDGWSLWTWLISRTSLLSGSVPESTATSAPDRVLEAARRFAAPAAA